LITVLFVLLQRD